MSCLNERYDLKITWNFFCSQHAHNIDDSHASLLKAIARPYKKQHPDKRVPSAQELHQMIKTYKDKNPNNNKFHSFVLPAFDETPLVFKKFGGISKFHQFEFGEQKGIFKARDISTYFLTSRSHIEKKINMNASVMEEEIEDDDEDVRLNDVIPSSEDEE